jgi:hypothetical protein
MYGFNLLMLTSTRLGSNLSIGTNKIILLGKQYWILYGPNHRLWNLGACLGIVPGNHST